MQVISLINVILMLAVGISGKAVAASDSERARRVLGESRCEAQAASIISRVSHLRLQEIVSNQNTEGEFAAIGQMHYLNRMDCLSASLGSSSAGCLKFQNLSVRLCIPSQPLQLGQGFLS